MPGSIRMLLFGSLLWALAPAAALAGLGRWTTVGPEGATVLSLAVDPTDAATVYAGTREGGVFKSVDSGAHWTFSGLAGSRVPAIFIDPSSPGHVVLSSGFESTDGGASWRTISLFPGTALAADPRSPGTLYAATYVRTPGILGYVFATGTLSRSVDVGRTWLPVGPLDGGVTAVTIDPVLPDTFYASVCLSGKYYEPCSIRRSTDGGRTWSLLLDQLTVVEDGFPYPAQAVALAAGAGSPAPLYASLSDSYGLGYGTFQKSADGGQTWSEVPAPGGLRVNALRVDPRDASILHAATAEGVFRSSDGAATWERVVDGESLSLAVAPSNPAVLYAGAGGGILASDDHGLSWRSRRAGLIATPVYDLVSSGGGQLFARSGLDVFRNAEDGSGWRLFETIPSSLLARTDFPGRAFAMDPVDPSFQYIGSRPSANGCTGVSRSFDAGETWSQTSLNFPCIRQFVFDPRDTGTFYAVGDRNGLWRATRHGDGWKFVSPSGSLQTPRSIDGFAVAPSDPDTLYASTPVGIFVSHDAGETWQKASDEKGDIRILIVDPFTPATVYASSGSLKKSTDGGLTWTSLGISTVTALAIDPVDPNNLFVATHSGVFFSSDGGATFSPLSSSPFPLEFPSSITALQLDAPGHVLHAATSGNGVFDFDFRPAVSSARPPAGRHVVKPRP